MNRRWIFLILGLGLLLFLVQAYGIENFQSDYAQVRWSGLLVLSLTFLPTLLGYSLAWLLCTPGAQFRDYSFFIFASIQSFAWNQLTPIVKVGGEFTKFQSLKTKNYPDPLLSVLVYNLAHTLGTVISFGIGGLVLVFHYEIDSILSAFLTGGSLFMLLLSFVIIFSPGVFHQLLMRFSKKEWATPFARIRHWIETEPVRFGASIFIEFLARIIEGITFYFAFQFLKEPISILTATLLEISRSLIDTAVFFVPYNLGAREGSVPWVLKEVFSEPRSVGLSAVLLYRWVELSWTVFGFLLWSVSSSRRKFGQSLG